MKINFTMSYDPNLIKFLQEKSEQEVSEAEELRGISKKQYEDLYNAILEEQGIKAEERKDNYEDLMKDQDKADQLLQELTDYYWQF